jgi:hypothetical protein
VLDRDRVWVGESSSVSRSSVDFILVPLRDIPLTQHMFRRGKKEGLELCML